ncbi:metalloprotease, partial [Parapusillimonas sp. SGNA-6]|uniref:KPN_02809 family neutral zinc metallopeptidase n=1 Tax=Parapedobacter sp. SGR-10 TaxID=2710879 RepID=UPI0013D3A395|nr:neutral zinc metallopeptidase [Parapedobacter sp. SGR-10]NGF56744.1 metalloprotease [Parapedobacter sp. SGR-10]NGM89457.1 metalloprotease [Parapusillimonas sp. SGNA-6]
MKWQGGRRGGNIEDRRRMSTGGKVALGGIGGVIVLLISLFMGGDPTQLLEQMQNAGGAATQQGEYQSTPEEDRLLDFADVVLVSTDDIWTALFRQSGQAYPKPSLVVYTQGTETGGCGYGQSAFGPFYCPGDQKIYLDLSFNRELSQRFGAKGEFALAYVIAHEVGHHIQQVLGVLQKTNAMRAKMSEREYNKISVMTELQADFYAGVWAHYVNKMTDIELTYDDIVDGMRAAAAVGDDHIQEQAHGHANPESFTHGTSEQRMYWFKKGYETGDIHAGDTFSDPSLR